MKYPIDSFQTDIEECIKLCREELFRRKNGVNGESTIDSLKMSFCQNWRRYYKKSEEVIYQ